MANRSKIIAIGNSDGIVLPKEILAKLRVERGEILYFTETPDGVQLSPYRPDFAAKMDAAERVMRKHRDVLRRLAK